MTTWNILSDAPAEFYNQHPELPPIVARLLWNRGLREQSQIDEFLNPDYLQDLHDPFLFNDMKKTVKIIFEAIKKQKNIVVHGDYDADGVCAAAIIINCLKKLGAKNVSVFLPHREIDGYGINLNTVEELIKQKTDLIITCDCGISNYDEIKAIKQASLQVIITDHHSIPDKIPKADAIIHPKMPKEKYPDKGLAGGGVAFKLIQALLKYDKEKNQTLPDGDLHEGFEKWLLDLVALATVGDMVPLLGESRTLVHYGLIVLNKTQNIGLLELFKTASLSDEKRKLKRKLDTRRLGFQVIPRLNAAGRMDHANTAFALLMAQTQEQAIDLAGQLNQNNLDRQKLTEKLVTQAKQQIIETGQTDSAMIFISGNDWPTGILGLVASRLKDCYYRPVLAMSMTDEIIASGRSIAEFNMIEALQSMPEFFDKFGGHPQACGLTLKDSQQLEEFKQAMVKKAQKIIGNKKIIPEIMIDAQVSLEEVDWNLYDLLQKFEPFGQANEEPKYTASELTITGVEPVGQDGKHLRLMVKHNSHTVRKTIGFGLGDCTRHPSDWKKNLKPGDKIDMVFTIGVNEWNGNRELQLTIEDIKKHE
ncbi:MAG: single-stranded-DNA-specific exonuclease RecJ [bacterium]